MKTTILGGALFLGPLVFLILLLNHAFSISRKIAAPLGRLIPIDRFAGFALADILAVTLILLICYLAGLLARGRIFARQMGRIDNFMIDLIPGYAVAKGVLGGVAQDTGAASAMRPVIVRFDDFEQLAYEIERWENKAVIYLPGSPSAWSGSSVIVTVDRVTPLAIPPHHVTGLLRVRGRGTGQTLLAGGSAETTTGATRHE
ncbi:hypothetical protein I5535_10100 [Rhodobacteraceae bacterium F11138]|nr:hypothetical protein [Rhodobacteraceae bacterium F11138]